MYLIRHTLGLFELYPLSRNPIKLDEPGGKISSQQLDVCKGIAADSEARLNKLEQKSTTLLSVVSVVAPLSVSAALFVAKEDLPSTVRFFTLSLDAMGAAFLVLAFFAVLRALAVRGQQQLFLNAVVDPAQDTIRDYDADFYGRGLLYVAASREAVSDHVADFVRSAQLFLGIGVICVLVAGTPVIFLVRDAPQEFEGSVRLHPATLNELRRITEDNKDVTHTARLEERLDSLLRADLDVRVRRELDALRAEVAALRAQKAQAPRSRALVQP
jgi:hypothetical protein